MPNYRVRRTAAPCTKTLLLGRYYWAVAACRLVNESVLLLTRCCRDLDSGFDRGLICDF